MTSDIESQKQYFSSTKENMTQCYIKENGIFYKDEKIVDISELKVKGTHNHENIMAAIIVAKILNIDNEIINKALINFNGVEHRNEFVKKVNSREFYNDSKSTNVVATITALKSFNTPVILLLGGLDRKHSFEDLKEHMNNVRLVIAYGETKERINEFCKQINKECIVVNNLEEATKEAYVKSNENDIILLSPACASWDQFKDFEQRGEMYKEYINNL